MKQQFGFTLIELMIVVVLMSILMSVGLPSFQAIIDNSRLTSVANTMLSAYQIARSEALKTHAKNNVYVVNTTDATQTGGSNTWKVTYMTNAIPADDTATPPIVAVPSTEKIISTFDTSKKIQVDFSSSNDFSGYDATGRPVTSLGIALRCTIDPCETNKIKFIGSTGTRTLEITNSGRVKITNP